jgi:hypothetical protein
VVAAVDDVIVHLSPEQDIVLPASGPASNSLEWLDALTSLVSCSCSHISFRGREFAGIKLMENRA